MQITTQHAEAVSQRARVGVKEGLLLDRIALHSADVAPRHVKSTALVVTDFADARLAIGNRATVTAGIAAHPVSVQLLVELALTNVLVDDVAKRGHGRPPILILDLWHRGFSRTATPVSTALASSRALRGIWRVPSTSPNKLPRKIPLNGDPDSEEKLGAL